MVHAMHACDNAIAYLVIGIRTIGIIACFIATLLLNDIRSSRLMIDCECLVKLD